MAVKVQREYLDVDPRCLRVPSSRASGPDPIKLQNQIATYGSSTYGMPPLEVTRGANGELFINNGATRAVRIAKLAPGQTVCVEVIDNRPTRDISRLPTVGDILP